MASALMNDGARKAPRFSDLITAVSLHRAKKERFGVSDCSDSQRCSGFLIFFLKGPLPSFQSTNGPQHGEMHRIVSQLSHQQAGRQARYWCSNDRFTHFRLRQA